MKHFNLFSLKNWSETNVVKGTRNYMASGTRTLLLALTLLCGVSNAWGACYYTISSAPTTINVVETGKGAFGVKLYNFPDTELGTFTNTYGVTSITFSFKKDGGTNTANVKLQYYDGTSWTDAVNSDGGKITCKAKNKETDNVNQKINPSSPTGQAIKYRLVRTDNPDFTSSDRYFTISNLTLQMNTTFSSDALVTIANTKIDESNEGYFDVSYSNMEGKTLSVTSSNPNEFIVSDVALDCSGTKSVTVTYKPTCEHHEESATITLKIDDVEKARVTANASWALNDGQAVNWRTLTDAEKKIQKGQSLDISSYASAKYSNGEGAVYYTSSNSGVISVGSDGHTLTAVSVGTAQIKAHVGNGCKYSGASSSEVTFTVSDKATPKFTPNWTSTNLKVGDKVTLTVENVSDGLNGYFKGTATKDNGKDILGITRFGNTITIEALNAGNSTATFTQTETGDIFGANPSYSFSVTKIANTLTVDATHSMYVDDIWNSVISGKNSDGAITTTTTDGTVAYYDVANNKIVAQNTNSQSFNSKEVTITISQADTYKYTAASKTITIIVNKYDNAIDIKGHGSSYSRDIYVGEVWDFSLSSNHTSSPIIATQNSGSDVAVMNSDHTQVISNSKEGQATWSISQPETYKYKEATGSLTVNVKKMGEESCEVVNKGETEYSEKLGNNTSEITWSEANVAEKLYFRAHRQSGSVEDKIQAQQKVNGSWQNVGNAITDMGTSYGSEYSIPLNQAATGVRFNIAGSFKNFVKNVRITRKKYLTTTSSLTINKNTSGGTLLVGESGTATLHVDWSICNGGELKVSSSDPRFTLSQTTISDATDGTNGSKDITVTYTPSEAGTFNADITVYNKVYRETTAVTGIAKAVPQITTPPSTTAVTYGQLLSNSNLSGGEAKAVVNGTLTGIEGSFAWENPNEVVTKAAGAQQYNVIFTPSKTDLYNNASGKATVTVNKATPTLTVTSPDTQKVYLDDTQTPKLDLVNYVTEYSAENDTHGHAQQKSAITYTCDKTSTGKIENGKFYATAEGTYTITATAPATDYYDKVEKTFTITVVKNENPITFQAGSSTVTTTTVDCESSSVVTVVTASTGALSVSAVQNGITPTISGKTLTFAAAAGSSNETATFTVSQATTTKYKAGSATITIYVKPIFRFAAVANVGPVKQGTVSASVTETSKIENYQTTSSSTTATFSATPNSGYHFDGWYTSSDCTGSAESTDSPYTPTITNTSAGSTTTKTLYAKFTANQHTLSWSTDGNPLTGNYTQGTVDFGTPIIQPNTPTKSGYTFAGWNATVPATMPDNDLSYTAQWTANSYTVTLDGNGGSGGSASVTATFGAAMPSADAPTRTGYTFQGYYDQKEGGTQYYNNDMSSAHAWDKAAATTLYAHWTANIYRVKLYANGGAFDNAGTPVSELWQDVAYGSPMPSGNPKPTRTGLEFIGFYDENGVQYYDEDMKSTHFWDKTEPNDGSNITLWAKWSMFQVNYNLNYEGANKTNLFTGWSEPKILNGVTLNYDPATSYITLNGTCTQNTPFIIQELPHIKAGDIISFKSTDFSWGDSEHNGWPAFETCDFTGAQASPRQAINVDGNRDSKGVTIKEAYQNMAVWVYINTKAASTNKFDNMKFKLCVEESSDFASIPSPSGKYVKRGEEYGTLAAPERAGYTFLGWFTEPDGGDQIESTTTFDGMNDQVLYAKWELTKTYTIYFDAQGGSACTSKKVIYHRTYGELPTTTRSGYVFDGWYTEITGGEQIFADTPVPNLGEDGATQTVYAHWTPVTVSDATPQTVDFVAQSETKTATLTFAVANASSKNDFNAPTIADDGWTITDWDYANNQVAVTVSYTATENTTTRGNHVSTVTLTAKSDNSATGTVTAHVEMTPVYTNTIAATYKVDDEAIDLNALWTSTSNGAKTYTITNWTPLKEGESGATKPAIVDNKLSLGQAGTLTLKLTQEAGTSSKASEDTHTLTINKYTPAMSWVEGGTYYTNTTYAADAFYTITGGEVPLFQITGSSDQEVARVQSDYAHVRFFDKIGATTITVTSAETSKWESVTWTKSFTPVANPNQAAFDYTFDFFNFEAITPSAGKIETTQWLFEGYQSDKLGKLRLTPSASSGDHNRASVTFSFGGSASKYEFEYSNNNSSEGVFAVYTGKDVVDLTTPKWKEKTTEQTWGTASADVTGANTIQMAYANNTGGGEWALMKVFGDAYIFVTDKTQLDYPVLPLNQSETQTVRLAHANVGYVTTVSSNIEQFSVSLDGNNFAQSVTLSDYDHAVTGGGLQGVVPIYIRYRASVEGEYSGTVTIQDNAGHSQSISVHGETQSELSTKMIWNTKTEFTGADTVIVNPFTVTDANGHVLSVPVTITSSNPDIMYVRSNGTLRAYCGGPVTITGKYAGTDGYKPCQLEQVVTVERCYQYIEWNQTFMDLTTDGSGQIDKTILLTAKAMDSRRTAATGAEITYSISEDDKHIASIINNGNGTYSLRITGVGTAYITASAAQTETFEAESITQEIRVRRQGEPCSSFAFYNSDEQNVGWFNDGNYYHYDVPGQHLSFKTRKGFLTLGGQEIIVAGSADGKTWSQIGIYTLSSNRDEQKDYDIDESYRYLRWTCTADIENNYRYIKNVEVTQKSYLRSSVTEISNDKVYMNEPFATTITISYSDVPVVNYSITNNTGANLSLTPVQSVNNDCGMAGSYTFTLAGMWSGVASYSETITFSTTDGKKIEIPVNITTIAGETFTFNQGKGNWHDSEMWEVAASTTHGKLPGMANKVVIRNEVTITEPVECLEVEMYNNSNAKIIIAPTGGLTIHNGGQSGLNQDNLIVQSSKSNQGFIRMSPDATNPDARKELCPAPSATVEYASKGDLSTGANKDATWQYFGSPVEETNFTVDYNTWLYEWSESQGWLYGWNNMKEPVSLKPFQGYAITQYGQPTYQMKGKLIMHDTIVSLTSGGAMGGDNMIANSYPAPLDTKRFADADFEGNIDKTFFIFNSGSWNEWKTGTNEGVDLAGNTPGTFTAIPILSAVETGEQTLVAPLQAICVHANSDAKIHFNYREHVWSAAPSNYDNMNAGLHTPQRILDEEIQSEPDYNAMLQKEWQRRDSIAKADKARIDALRHRVRINIYGENSGVDHIYLLERDGYTPNYDNGYDARKMWAENGTVNIYTTDQDGYMAVSASNRVDSTYVGVVAGDDNAYTITFTSVIGDSLYLKDLITNVETPIKEGQSYHFNIAPTTDDDFRFIVLEHPMKEQPFVPTGNDPVGANTYIWVDANNLHIENASASSVAMLYTTDSKLLLSKNIHHNAIIPIRNLIPGMYIVKVDGKLMKFVKE